MNMQWKCNRGKPFPLGATVDNTKGCVNFALFSKEATKVELCLFEVSSLHLLGKIVLDPEKNKTGQLWHIEIEALELPCCYGYRLEGPMDDPLRYRFDPALILLDPYAKAVDTPREWGQKVSFERALKRGWYQPQGIIYMEQKPFDWQEIRNPRLENKDLIIYEMHVRGFTFHPSSCVGNPGTFLGIIEKIPYFLELGINAIELMPICEFNEMELPRRNPKTNQLLYNYWGYSTVNFFSLMNRYAVSSAPAAVIQEFKLLVRELHRHGIELILDVVFNHTAEALDDTLSYRGIDNPTYYLLDTEGKYLNFTGCGNTFNGNHPVAKELIIDCLRYFASEFQVDGFRFDLASSLARDTTGAISSNAPLIDAIAKDPLLANLKLIAEPWDLAIYQVGSFSKDPRWAEWNGQYRDVIRRFIKGDADKPSFATRLSGSQDLYDNGRLPTSSINFITAHDGFTLADLVSYNQKHNLENGEENRDGLDANDSWNCGVEGETQIKKILALRERQMKNLHLALMVSQGIPMLLMGDEYGHTRQGNNNPWSQDNELNWFLWDQLAQKKEGFFRFYSKLIAFRKQHSLLKKGVFLTDQDVDWHGIKPLQPRWQEDDKVLALTLKEPVTQEDLYIAFNASPTTAKIELPTPPPGKVWHRIVETSLSSPDDFIDLPRAPAMKQLSYSLIAHSALLFKAHSLKI